MALSGRTANGDVHVAAVEGGGTTFVVSIARVLSSIQPSSLSTAGAADVISLDPRTALEFIDTLTVPSSSISPSETLTRCASFLKEKRPPGGYSAVGVATFGPVGVDPSDANNYGKILPGSPKKEWRGVDVLTPVLEACADSDGSVPPHGMDTDVNAPAVAEFIHHCAISGRGGGGHPVTSLAYVTVGTGVGVGLVVNSSPVHGMMHPEGGHVTVAPLDGDDFEGYSWGRQRSPYGGKNSVEGVTSSVALTERLVHMEGGEGSEGDDAAKRDALKDLSDDHPVWSHAANALANLCTTLALLTSAEKIVLGGGVMRRAVLFRMVRERTREILNGYLDLPQVTTDEGLEGYICGSAWGDRAGLVGAFALAVRAMEEDRGGGSNGGVGEGAKAVLKEPSKECSYGSGFIHGLAVAAVLGAIGFAALRSSGR